MENTASPKQVMISSADDKRVRRTSQIGINCKPYKIKIMRQDNTASPKQVMISCVKWKNLNEERREETALTVATKHQAIGNNR